MGLARCPQFLMPISAMFSFVSSEVPEYYYWDKICGAEAQDQSPELPAAPFQNNRLFQSFIGVS